MHRTLLNLVLSFCGGHPRLPHPFLACGYTDDVIVEREFLNEDGEQINFDVILNSQEKGAVILLEIKGALGHEEAHDRFREQRQRYSRVTATELRGQSGVSLPEDGPLKFNVTYLAPSGVAQEIAEEVGNEESEVVFSVGLVDLTVGFAFQACDVIHGRLVDDEIQEALNLNCDPVVPIPDHYFPFDEHTHRLKIAFEIYPFIQTLYSDGDREGFTDVEVAERAIRVWPYLSREYRQSLSTVVRSVIKAISDAPGNPKYSWDNNERIWRFEEPAEERVASSPPELNKPARKYLAEEWNVDQIDAFFG